MRLISLELRNFRQHVDSRIDFTQGVTGIIGPNGAGKTTLLEGIAWALYGAPAVRGTNDTIRSTASEGGTKASAKLTFELTGNVYTVLRSLDGAGRSGTAALETDGRPLRNGVNEVNTAVTRLLGMDYQAFFTSFFTGQKQLEFMASLDGRARAAAISRMLGYERISRARDQANQDRLGLQREIEGLERGLPDPEELKQRKRDASSQLSAAQNMLKQVEKDHVAWERKVGELKPLKEASDLKAARREELVRRLEFDRAEVDRAAARLDDLQTELRELDRKRSDLASMQGDLKRYEEAREEYRRLAELQKHDAERQRLAGQISSLERDITALRSREKALANAGQARLQADAALAEAEKILEQGDLRLAELRQSRAVRLQVLRTEIERLTAARADVMERRRRIAEAGEEGRCPTCERKLAGELPKVLAGFDAQIEDFGQRVEPLVAEMTQLEADDSDIREAQEAREKIAAEVTRMRTEKSRADARAAEFDSVSSDLQSRTSQLEELRAEMASLPSGFDQARFAELRRIGEELRPVREKAVATEAALEREPAVRAEIENTSAALDAKHRQVVAAEKALDELSFSPEDHEDLVRRFDEAVAGLAAAAVALERRRGEVNTANAVLQHIEREEESYRSRLADLNSKRAHRLSLQTLAEALDKLRAELNARIRPELESIASELLAAITDGRYNVLEIDDSYRAVIRDDGELKPVISGGEEDVVNLALRLAVSQMIADRAGQAFSLLILDEVFGSLDESRRDNVVALLQNLKNRFEQIILITHIESIHDAVDNCLWVEFDEKSKTSRLTDRLDRLGQPDIGALV